MRTVTLHMRLRFLWRWIALHLEAGGGGEPLELNHPICAAALRFFWVHKQVLIRQTSMIYLLHLDWVVVWSLQAVYSCWAHWFVLKSFDPTWNEGLRDLAGSQRWGREDGRRACLLSLPSLSTCTPGLSAYRRSECIIYNQSLLHAEETSKQRESRGERILFSHSESNSSVDIFLSFFKGRQACDFDLETFFNLNNWSKTLHGRQNLAQWFPQIDTMQLKGDVCLVWGCLRWAYEAHSGGGSDNARTGQRRQGCCAAINIKRLQVSSLFRAAQSNKTALITPAFKGPPMTRKSRRTEWKRAAESSSTLVEAGVFGVH